MAHAFVLILAIPNNFRKNWFVPCAALEFIQNVFKKSAIETCSLAFRILHVSAPFVAQLRIHVKPCQLAVPSSK